MSKSILVTGFGAIGKTTLASKYKNILDLESSSFKYIIDDELKKLSVEERKGLKTRKLNPKYPDNYYEAIIENLNKYDIVLISMHNEIIEKLENDNIEYIVVYPKEEMLDEIIERCKKRGNKEDFLSGVKDAYYRLYPSESAKVFWLDKGKYIEDILKENNLV